MYTFLHQAQPIVNILLFIQLTLLYYFKNRFSIVSERSCLANTISRIECYYWSNQYSCTYCLQCKHGTIMGSIKRTSA